MTTTAPPAPTTPTSSAPPPPAPSGSPGDAAAFWRGYGRMWRGAPKDLAAVTIVAIMGFAAFGLMWGLFASGIGLLFAALLGVFVLLAAFLLARWLGEAEMRVLEWAGRPRIPRPAWPSRAQHPGFFRWLGAWFASPHAWLALAHYLLPQFVLSIITVTVATTSVGIAIGGTSWILWGDRLPSTPLAALDLELGELWLSTTRFVLGLIFLAALPYILRGLTWAHWGLARGLLGAFRSDALERELAGAEASRAAAVSAEDSALRRIERDIHDGPQQRLIRLQMDLASAERRLAESPEESRALLASAATQAREALDELRALSRGFAPPILLDRGLVAALESAATRIDVPTALVNGLPAGLVLPPEVERNAYFIASEGLANAAKHAGATRIGIALTADAAGRALTVTVQDDGRGGAKRLPGHGLVGLEERLLGLGGTLELTSPEGGPTVLTARLPW